ncbi:mRNAadenosine methylase [Artemisia annua]|uniref:mRNAadenosine methylase n=1 Tax=Artemisia annua TaxID=35608 RepID=A0A2U1PD13_ARTAN|nr:mRNAadenosine methylase [Artemisia annua]
METTETSTSSDTELTTNIKDIRTQLETRIQTLHTSQLDLISSLQNGVVPDLTSSLNLNLKVISTFNNRHFTPLLPNPNPNPNPSSTKRRPRLTALPPVTSLKLLKPSPPDGEVAVVVRAMVAVCLLERVPFTEIDSVGLLTCIESDGFQSVSDSEKARLRDSGEPILAVESALKAISEENGGVVFEEVRVNGRVRVLVKGIDRVKLVKELPESKQSDNGNETSLGNNNVGGWVGSRGVGAMGRGAGGMYSPMKAPRTEEDDMKDVEALLNKKSFKELQKSKTGEELMRLIHRPTAKETAVAAKFKSKGGSQVKEYCTALTKEDCRRQSGSFISCEKVHFRRIIAPHTDMNLGDCSFLDTCRHMKTCKYVHYELDSTPEVAHMMMGVPKPIKPLRPEYCSEVELGESQWINCDIRNFRMDILGQYGVIMADPPWDIHMELPYGTMADDEMRGLNIQALQTDGLIFLWVTGRAMELGRECLELWGYKRVEEIIWVKTNQLQRIIRTGRTGHWLNHSKEHCLVGIKGDPIVNRNIDTDVIVAEVRETSRKPDEMYPLLERISPRTRKLELFARMHNTHAGWMSLGNQLSGARLVDEGLRARFKAAYPEVDVQPHSPPRASVMEVESPFAGGVESKPMSTQFSDVRPSEPTTYSAAPPESKPMNLDAEMTNA